MLMQSLGFRTPGLREDSRGETGQRPSSQRQNFRPYRDTDTESDGAIISRGLYKAIR